MATYDNVNVKDTTREQPAASIYAGLEPTTREKQTMYQQLSQAAPINEQDVYANVT
jgi:hypothetical protein